LDLERRGLLDEFRQRHPRAIELGPTRFEALDESFQPPALCCVRDYLGGLQNDRSRGR
jgi:hypothetical protein